MTAIEDATYGWIITRDLLSEEFEPDVDEASMVGTAGPYTIPQALYNRLIAGEGEEFRLLDDDGILYYLGRILYTNGEPQDEEDFGPLWDFGAPDSGATEIQYRVAGRWKTL